MNDNTTEIVGARWQMWPLYAAGFTTAFGAHAVAANLVFDLDDLTNSVLYLGLLLALYDGAEVLLKPVFGTLADRVGAKPVLLGGLIAFSAASLLFVVVADTEWLWLARLGQGAAASAFSPAASSSVARLTPKGLHGSAFGTYGFYKSLGYTLGPLLGGVIVWTGGLTLLFAVMAALAVVVAIWATVVVPALAPYRGQGKPSLTWLGVWLIAGSWARPLPWRRQPQLCPSGLDSFLLLESMPDWGR